MCPKVSKCQLTLVSKCRARAQVLRDHTPDPDFIYREFQNQTTGQPYSASPTAPRAVEAPLSRLGTLASALGLATLISRHLADSLSPSLSGGARPRSPQKRKRVTNDVSGRFCVWRPHICVMPQKWRENPAPARPRACAYSLCSYRYVPTRTRTPTNTYYKLSQTTQYKGWSQTHSQKAPCRPHARAGPLATTP